MRVIRALCVSSILLLCPVAKGLEVMMSIPHSERRKLRAIEFAIADAEPALADRYALFAALHRSDDMPRGERLKARDVRRTARAERWITLWLPT